MFPAQTSLIPATIALIRFFEEKGLSAFSLNYPYWYLGSTPYRFLIGPITPILVNFINNLLPFVSLFSILISLVILSFVFSAIGWGILVKKISGNKILAYGVALIFLILPGKYVTGLGLEEATYTIARNLLPFFFIFVYDKKKILSILCLSLILLINTGILIQVLVGIGAISLNFKYLKRNLLIIVGSLAVITIWYTPGYWFTNLFNPSIGGLSVGKLFLRIFELARSFVPILLAFFMVRAGKVKRTVIEKFGLIWLGIFTFLSFYRFIADYNFWSDWTAWIPELEIGFAIMAVHLFQNHKFKYIFLLSLIVLIPSWVVLGKIPLTSLISSNPPKIYDSLTEVSKIAEDKTVFLSGTTVFWADALYNIRQVRGGRDQFAVHPTWDKTSYELREGTEAGKTQDWLTKLNIGYVLVHTESSEEYYHDFKSMGKWFSLGEKVYEDNGDFILKI